MFSDMGSQISGPDEEHLLIDADEAPLFEKIKIVLIGYHEAGKNAIGNTILRKKAFTQSTDDEGSRASESHRDGEGPHTSEHKDFLRGWTYKLNSIMEELTEDQFKRMIHMMQMRDEWRIPAGQLDGRGRASVTQLLVQKWGEHRCIINTRDIMKDIPRNDSVIRGLLMPFLEHIGETWIIPSCEISQDSPLTVSEMSNTVSTKLLGNWHNIKRGFTGTPEITKSLIRRS
ncbi:hypothetical protein AOLI_G00106800 [Acnodon oligacanthus]